MSQIRSADTSPERQVRSILHGLGYRFRLHSKNLPGTPDVVLPRYSTVVLVHGCFWHRHAGCKFAYMPKSRKRFWEEKFEQNIKRDARVIRQLKTEGWRVVTVWECELADVRKLAVKLRKALTVARARQV
jgi:DNA mismatch endonuclease (patch repair protein)